MPPFEDGGAGVDLKLKDRVVLIAGASRGIGLAIAEALLSENAKVALTARGAEGLEETRAHLAKTYGADKLWTLAGDMRDPVVIENTVERVEAEFGPLWGAVANVGLHPCPMGFEIDDATWDGAFSQNLDSAYRLARSALRRMTAREEGSLLFISSICGVEALGSPLAYGVAKAGMNHMSKELARIAGPLGVRVNTIAPGNIIFPGGDWEERTRPGSPEADMWNAWIDREVPLKRFGTPEEIGTPAAFLLSPITTFLTGAVLPIDGGQTR
jgi:3-oxoacyl-[acyl-carrier protein] reductase